jgi:hypothetical protein
MEAQGMEGRKGRLSQYLVDLEECSVHQKCHPPLPHLQSGKNERAIVQQNEDIRYILIIGV